MTPELAAENAQVLNLVQAMLGLVSPVLRLVTLEMGLDGIVVIRLLLERDGPEEIEDVEDIIFEFEALQIGPVVESHVLIDSRPLSEVGVPGRMVYCRKEEEPNPLPVGPAHGRSIGVRASRTVQTATCEMPRSCKAGPWRPTTPER